MVFALGVVGLVNLGGGGCFRPDGFGGGTFFI